LKNLPENINKRFGSLSSSEEKLNTTIQPYQEALSNSAYDYRLKYIIQHLNPTKIIEIKKKQNCGTTHLSV